MPCATRVRLTIGACTIATAVLETGSNRESMTAKDVFQRARKAYTFQKAHGGMRLMSVLEPQPAHVGLVKVISTKVQFSPLKLQPPAEEISSNARRSKGTVNSNLPV